ncbi:MAG: hypothetical protein ICV84_16165 [Flavisolibacter sp.]|nr:hypothetical protein [Flavisolibacter sp.]
MHYKDILEVDLIPFGEIENEEREVRFTKPKAFTLQMPGFSEAFPFIEPVQISCFRLNACPLEGIVMLKLISHDDRPERTHDLTDIDNIIDNYFDWNADEIFGEHNDLFENYDVHDPKFYQPMIAAHVIGIRMNRLLARSPELKRRVVKILKGNDNPRWIAMLNAMNDINP